MAATRVQPLGWHRHGGQQRGAAGADANTPPPMRLNAPSALQPGVAASTSSVSQARNARDVREGSRTRGKSRCQGLSRSGAADRRASMARHQNQPRGAGREEDAAGRVHGRWPGGEGWVSIHLTRWSSRD